MKCTGVLECTSVLECTGVLGVCWRGDERLPEETGCFVGEVEWTRTVTTATLD